MALLRGINVSGKNMIPMAVLRERLAGLGYAEVTTYLQSGNAVFTAPEGDPAEVAAEIEDDIAEALGLSIRILIRTADELRAVIEHNPLPVREPAKFLVSFLETAPDPERWAAFDAAAYAPEEMAAGEREIYFYLPNGIGRAKLPDALNRTLHIPSTARNWNTVTKLLELAES